MKNTYDEQIECLQHLKAGGKLEWYDYDRNWSVSPRELPSFDCHKYRPLVEKYAPKAGETVLVGNAVEATFHHEYEGRYFVKSGLTYYAYDEVKPIEQPKPVAREWYAAVKSNGDLIGTVQQMGSSMLVVREVLE